MARLRIESIKSGILYLALAVVVTAPLLWRARFVDLFVYLHTGTPFYAGLQSLAHDAIIYFLLIAITYVSLLPRMPRTAAILLRLGVVAFFAIYVADIVILSSFATHLTWPDLQKYYLYAPQYIGQVYGWMALPLILAALWGSGRFVMAKGPIRSRAAHITIIGLLALSLGVSCFGRRGEYVHSWLYKNVLQYNRAIATESREYSPQFIQQFSYRERLHCVEGPTGDADIIILMVESLSAYQSEFFSGIRNWTPNLDRIAAESLSFTSCFANGFTTEDAEIALLTGRLPIYGPQSYSDGGSVGFAGFFGFAGSLPAIAAEQGYTSDFITSADLSFSDTGRWAESIGFDYVEGHQHPDYAGWKRYQFLAAPDAALYGRVLDRLRSRNPGQPLFMFVKTVTTHHPFVHPETETPSEAGAFAYADEQLGAFYDALQKQGFFEDGILIIVGDHHAMVPLRPDEVEQYGLAQAGAMIPLVIAGTAQRAAVVDRAVQQTDVFNSLRNYLSTRKCTSQWLGDLLRWPIVPARFLTHRRGDDRNVISVFEGADELRVLLDGDDTRIVSLGEVDPSVAKEVVSRINWRRIELQGSR